MDLIKRIHHYLSDDIVSMNNIILNSVSVNEDLIGLVSNHLASAGGKRIRPILTMLTAKMYGYTSVNVLRLAAAVELMHMGTLLHDDVIDGSTMRRFVPTANVIWGNNASILVGDFLFNQSFKLMISTKSFPILEMLSNTFAIIVEGEVIQLVHLENKKNISQKDYFQIINAKTGELFAASCGVGAIISEQESDVNILKEFGKKLGNIFQIADDALDYFSESTKVGKNTGDDFYEGKITLPLIFLLKKVTAQEKLDIEKILSADKRSKSDFIFIKDLMQQYNIRSDIEVYLEKLKLETEDILLSIRSNTDDQSKQYLQELVGFAVKRAY